MQYQIPADQIAVREATDLGSGNFRIRLAAGHAGNEIVQSDIVTAATLEEAVEKARADFSRWLRKVFDMAGRR